MARLSAFSYRFEPLICLTSILNNRPILRKYFQLYDTTEKFCRYKLLLHISVSFVHKFKEFFISRKAPFPTISYSTFTVRFGKLSDSKKAEQLSLNFFFVKQFILKRPAVKKSHLSSDVNH